MKKFDEQAHEVIRAKNKEKELCRKAANEFAKRKGRFLAIPGDQHNTYIFVPEGKKLSDCVQHYKENRKFKF